MSAVNPYARPASRVTQLDAASETYTAAGAGRRLRAYLTDAVIMYLLTIPLIFAAAASVAHFGLFKLVHRRGDSDGFMAFAAVPVSCLALCFYVDSADDLTQMAYLKAIKTPAVRLAKGRDLGAFFRDGERLRSELAPLKAK